MNAPISLHEPQFDQDDEALVLETLRSTWVSTGGPFVDKFEKDFAEYVGSKHAVSVASGTVALQLMLEVLAHQRSIMGSFDVIMPSLTFIATANAIVHAGGRPILVDCAAGSVNLDVEHVKSIIREQYDYDSAARLWLSRAEKRPLLAVMPVHILGWACAMEQLRSFCQEIQVPILEDAAEALGSYFADGTHFGRTGLAAAFSFNGNKILTTGGGGMIVTDDDHFAHLAKHLSTTAKRDGLRFTHDMVGHNFRLVNILAALGCSQMQKLPARLQRKHEIFTRYKRELAATKIRIHEEGDFKPNHWLVTAIFTDYAGREAALAHLMRHNIQARPLWTPVHLQPAHQAVMANNPPLPRAEDIWQRALSLPSSPQLVDAKINEICGLLKESQL